VRRFSAAFVFLFFGSGAFIARWNWDHNKLKSKGKRRNSAALQIGLRINRRFPAKLAQSIRAE
jgi:hypothetical protein